MKEEGTKKTYLSASGSSSSQSLLMRTSNSFVCGSQSAGAIARALPSYWTKVQLEKIRYQSKLNQTCILLTARVKDEFLRLSSSTRLLKILIGLSEAKNLFANFSSLHALVSLATKS
jgi:hypothetical protein